MTITEAQRFELHLGLQGALGDNVANTLMEHLPPSGWSDVVRLRDLEEFEKRMDLRFQLVDMRFEQIDHRFHTIDQRFEQIDHRFDTVATKDDLALVHVQMNGLSRDINRLNRGFAVLVGGMSSGFAAVMVLLIQLNMNISQL
jgi:type II secretory pathway predicted ATPase ExeA